MIPVWRIVTPFRHYIRSVRGKHNIPTGQFIVAANHESAIDAAMIILALNRSVRFVASGHLLSPRDRLFLYNILVIFGVGRSISSGNGALERCKKVLAKKKILAIFPEGDIHPKYAPGRIHTGVMALSHQLQIPVLPISLHGTGALWPITGWLRPWKTHSVDIVIGKPVQPTDPRAILSREQYQSMSDALMWMIRKLPEETH